MRKFKYWIIFIVFLLSQMLTGAALATPAVSQDKPEDSESYSAGSITSPPKGIFTTSYEYTNTTPVVIPDSTCVTSTLDVTDAFATGDLNVGIWIAHTYRADIDMRLIAPDLTSVYLMQDDGGGADNVNALFDDSSPNPVDSNAHTPPPPYYTAWWHPEGELADFLGIAPQGTWTLEVCDDAGGDTGTLNQWTLYFTTGLIVTPETQEETICKGSNATYDLTVVNATTYTGTFDIAYSNIWPIAGPGITPILNPGDVFEFSVTHHIPWSANAGDVDTATITVTGGGETAVGTVTTTAATYSGWEDYETSPAARGVRAPSVVHWDGKLYKIGGYNVSAQPWLDIYDIATDTWSQGADMPAGRYWLDCEAIDLTGSDAKIYCAGGYLSSGQTTLYIYDISDNLWSEGTAMSAYRYSYASVALNDKYYVIAGYGAGYPATIWEYDPATNVWNYGLTNMAVGRRYHSAGVIGGKIYVAGGYNGSYLDSLEIYDPALGTWSTGASMPTPWLYAADGVIDDQFLALAGGSATSTASASNGTLIYDALTDTWDSLPLFNHMVYGAEGDFDGTDFWVVSGRLYEGGTFSYSHYTTKLVECDAVCTPITGLDFTWDPAQPLTGLPVDFEASYTAGSPPVEFAWDFGDGFYGVGQYPHHMYLVPGTYTVELTATNCDGGSSVTVTHDVQVIDPPTIHVAPDHLHAIQLTDQITTQTIEICNLGDADLTWELKETEPEPPLAQAPLPETKKTYEIMRKADGSVDCAAYENYAGFEPVEVAAACPVSMPVIETSGIMAPTDIGYALDIGYVSDNFVSFALNDFPGQTTIGTNADPFYGMDFDVDGEVLWALNDTTGQLGTIDLTSGAFTAVVPCPPGGGAANWTGMTIDPVTGTVYASTATDLFTIDPATGASTLIGPFGTTLMIDIAINMAGQMYGHDIGTDSIYSIDVATGAATLIGLTGYAANYAQGMDFDNNDGTLYIFLYIGSGANVYGTVNLATGAVTPLATDNPLGEFEGAIAIPGIPFDIPWAIEDPLSGMLAPDACETVTVTFDSAGLAVGEYYGSLKIESNDPFMPIITVPIHLSVWYGTFLPLIAK